MYLLDLWFAARTIRQFDGRTVVGSQEVHIFLGSCIAVVVAPIRFAFPLRCCLLAAVRPDGRDVTQGGREEVAEEQGFS